MTSEEALADLAQQLRAHIVPDFDNLTIAPEEDDCPPIFAVYPMHKMTHDEVVSACKEMATIIRDVIPESPDGWSAAIIVEPWYGIDRTIYFIGWAGRTDEWQLANA